MVQAGTASGTNLRVVLQETEACRKERTHPCETTHTLRRSCHSIQASFLSPGEHPALLPVRPGHPMKRLTQLVSTIGDAPLSQLSQSAHVVQRKHFVRELPLLDGLINHKRTITFV